MERGHCLKEEVNLRRQRDDVVDEVEEAMIFNDWMIEHDSQRTATATNNGTHFTPQHAVIA